MDDVTPARSARNADARTLLHWLYEQRPRRDRRRFYIFKRGEGALGMSYERLLEAASLLFYSELCDSRGPHTYQITDEGIDAVETPALLDEHLPVRRDGLVVTAPDMANASSEVAAALADARAAIARGEAPNAIDRVHTMLHARVRDLCRVRGVPVAEDSTLPQLFTALWKARQTGLPAHPQAERVLRSMGGALEALSELRNNASLAHGRALPDDADAFLAINTAHTIASYIEARFRPGASPNP